MSRYVEPTDEHMREVILRPLSRERLALLERADRQESPPGGTLPAGNRLADRGTDAAGREGAVMIKATEALRTFSAELEAESKEAESVIDRRIESMGDDEWITVNLQHVTTSQRVLRRLEQAYRDGGWDVTVVPVDGRGEGPFIRLRVASPPRSGPGST